MPIITVDMFKGRSDAQKSEIVRELTDAFVRTGGGSAEAVHVILRDVEKSNWGSGGIMCSEKFPD